MAGSPENSNLLYHIEHEIRAPIITMCACDDEKAVAECLAIAASCFHVVKPLTTGSLNILKQKALHHKAKMAILEVSRVSMGSAPAKNSDDHGEVEIARRPRRSSKKRRANRCIWTAELHWKFLRAVNALGHQAVPKKILSYMQVHGLTAKQVGSHLQKHREREQAARKKAKQSAALNPTPPLLSSPASAPARFGLTATRVPPLPFPATAMFGGVMAAYPAAMPAPVEQGLATAVAPNNARWLTVWNKFVQSVQQMGRHSGTMGYFLNVDFVRSQVAANSAAGKNPPSEELVNSATNQASVVNAHVESCGSINQLTGLHQVGEAAAELAGDHNHAAVEAPPAPRPVEQSCDLLEFDLEELRAILEEDHFDGPEEENVDGSNGAALVDDDAWADVLGPLMSPDAMDGMMAFDAPEQPEPPFVPEGAPEAGAGDAVEGADDFVVDLLAISPWMM